MKQFFRGHRVVLVIVASGLLAAALLADPPQSAPTKSGLLLQSDETRGSVTRRASEFTVVPGYIGPKYDDGGSGRVVVLTDTLAARPGSAAWTVSGLLQNETDSVVRISAVTGLLSDSAGKELGTVAASIPLSKARPGEPIPFVASSDVAANLVASMSWKITYVRELREPRVTGVVAEVKADPDRTLEFTIYWTRPYGNEDRRYGYPQDDRPEGPYPHVVFGSLHNFGTVRTSAAHVVAAWLDKEGRVIHVDRLELRILGKVIRSTQLADIPAGGDVDFFYSNNDPNVAPLLADARMVLWGAASE